MLSLARLNPLGHDGYVDPSSVGALRSGDTYVCGRGGGDGGPNDTGGGGGADGGGAALSCCRGAPIPLPPIPKNPVPVPVSAAVVEAVAGVSSVFFSSSFGFRM